MKATGPISSFESPAKEYTQKPLSLDELLLPHLGDTYLVEMNSDDMTDAGIHHHDILVVDASLTASDNDIIVCSLDDEMICCAFNRTRQTISNNRLTKHLSADHDLLIFGVVANSVRCHHQTQLFTD